MKRYITLFLLVLSSCLFSSYQWNDYGPSGVNAFKIKFLHYGTNGVLFTDTGFYLMDGPYGSSWDFYDFYARDAAFYNDDTVLLIYNEGTYSDGIYFMDINTHEGSIVDFYYKPNFLHYTSSKYFMGCENGLYESMDGFSWNEISLFSGMNCISMTSNSSDLVLAVDSAIHNTFVSQDDGQSWSNIILNLRISDLESGDAIYGLCVDGLSSGIYSLNFGTWHYGIKLHENVSALGVDNMGTPFIGWNNGTMPYKGIARFRSPKWGLEYYNLGLPNTNINDISNLSFITGGEVVFCCTDSGAYWCGINVGLKENESEPKFTSSPNPFSNNTSIIYHIDSPGVVIITIYNSNGQLIMTESIEHRTPGDQNYIWQPTCLINGLYYCNISTPSKSHTLKLVCTN